MSRNEAQTRFDLIDPALEARGWLRSDIRIEETAAPVDMVYGKGQRRAKGRTDYVLRRPLEPGTEGIPLAIIEAKREGLPPEHGLQQGKGYRVGRLHNVFFVFSSNGHLFVEYHEETGVTSEPRPISGCPAPDELVERYYQAHGLQPAARLRKTVGCWRTISATSASRPTNTPTSRVWPMATWRPRKSKRTTCSTT